MEDLIKTLKSKKSLVIFAVIVVVAVLANWLG
jgi:hypothetical protein